MADPVTDYARAVLAGTNGRPVCVLERLACQRHLDDLERGPARGLRFDAQAAVDAVDFFAILPLTTGRERQMRQLVLQPWQAFIAGSLWGWYREDGRRRFRKAYIELPRKNGKSTFCAGFALRLAFFDGESRAEVYCAATKREQAKRVFDEAAAMVRRTPGLKTRIQTAVGSLYSTTSGSKLAPLGADADTTDGLNISGAIVDELHAHKTRAMVDVLDTGTSARDQPMTIEITTAGFDRQTICYEHHEYSQRLLEGVFEDDSWFTFITGIDPGDDWADERVWSKANPNLHISVDIEDLRAKAAKAARVPTDQNTFRRLHLNEWTEQEDRWLDIAAWQACAGAVDETELEGEPCYIGLDLSSTRDLTAYVLLFRRPDDTYAVLPRFFLPAARVAMRAERRDRVPLDSWVRDGLLVATPGDVVDQGLVRAALNEDAKRFDVRELCVDPWNATALTSQLQEDGFTVVEIRQGYKTLSPPTKELETLVLSKRLIHGGHPVLTWCASNVAVDPAGNIKPSKRRARDRIDGIAALVTALSRAMVQAAPVESIYLTRGVLTLGEDYAGT
jgi:phage terminase large subunit-like protein